MPSPAPDSPPSGLRPGRRALLGLILVALLVSGGVFGWRFYRSAEDAAAGTTAAEMALREKLRGESAELERVIARIAQQPEPAETEVELLQRAVANQREWMRLTGDAGGEQEARLQQLEKMQDEVALRSWIARTAGAEAAARLALVDGRRDEAVMLLRTALDLQRLIDRTPAAGAARNLARETELAQAIDRIQAEPIAAALRARLDAGAKQFAARQWAEALATYTEAEALQLRLNREFGNTQFASIAQLGRIEAELQSVRSIDAQEETEAAATAAAVAETQRDWPAATAAWERAATAQRTINEKFPRSRFASAPRLDELEVSRQSAASAPRVEQVAEIDRQIAAHLCRGDLAAAVAQIGPGAAAGDELFQRYPLSRRLDAGRRLRLNYLSLMREKIPMVHARLARMLVPIPGRSGIRMLRTEVMQDLYALVAERNPSRNSGPGLPVESVSEREAAEFCLRLSWMLGRPARLPTEAEFRAALGPVPPVADLASQIWSMEVSGQKTRPVEAGPPNAAGFVDLLGNVAEWLQADSDAAKAARVAGGSCLDPLSALAKIPVEQWSRNERARTVGFRFVVIDL